MEKYKIAVIIPIRNAQTTILETLGSLVKQAFLFNQLIIVNDASADRSMELVANFLDEKRDFFEKNNIGIEIVNHNKSKGLAGTYNDGIKSSLCELVVTLHSDVILDDNSLQKLAQPFFLEDQERIVASYHVSRHPFEIWDKYNFWQKCFFARKVGIKEEGLDGKFDCFRKAALLAIGLFDAETYKNAGEDGDVVSKLKKIGKVVRTDAEIIHLHSMDPKFSFKDILKKQKQYSEAQGILLRRNRIANPASMPKMFFRELLVISLFVPYLNILSALAIVIYSFMYTKLIFLKEYKNPRIFLLPFLNIYLLFVSFAYLAKGFVRNRQSAN
jgi:glycosyltransferase involved in cell wall biosynthesis